MKEDGRTVLGTDVITLTVEGSGIMKRKEDLEEYLERKNSWVELDLDGLGVVGTTSADLLVAGVG